MSSPFIFRSTKKKLFHITSAVLTVFCQGVFKCEQQENIMQRKRFAHISTQNIYLLLVDYLKTILFSDIEAALVLSIPISC